jgi:hypothetical protein
MSHVALASRPKRKKQPYKQPPPSADSVLIFGGQAIANALGCSLEQFYYLHNKGVLDGIVVRLGHKTLAASRAKLRELPELIANKT